MTAIQLLLGTFTLITNAFFVGAEFALISVRRSHIEPAAQSGNLRARSAPWGLEHPSAMMATAQLGIILSSLVLGAVAEPAITRLLQPPFHAIGVRPREPDPPDRIHHHLHRGRRTSTC